MDQTQKPIDNELVHKQQFLYGLEDVKFGKEYGSSDMSKDPTTTTGLLYKQGWFFGKDVSPQALDSLINNMKHMIETHVKQQKPKFSPKT